jgi:tetratricopeptide (TPR) repeat protein
MIVQSRGAVSFATCALGLIVSALVQAQPQPQAEEIPVTTASGAARMDFVAGQAALDRGDGAVANALFRAAVARDPGFGYAWFNLANASFSTEEFASSLKQAAAAASRASEGERMLVEVAQRFLDSDFESQIATARRLTERYPGSVRAWINLAIVQGGRNQFAAQRASLARALELDPRSIAAHVNLANSYLFNEPRDLALAEKHFRHAVALDPGESNFHWGVGDTQRALNRLEQAREHYERATLVDPNDGVARVKLGHINSFLGRYEEARRDFERGVVVAEPPNKPFYANYGAFTWVHAGDAGAALGALRKIVENLDSSGLAPQQRDGSVVFTLTNAATIALHHGLHEDAAQLIGQLAAQLRANAKKVGTEEFSRIQEAQIAYLEGQLAARRGDYREAERLARRNAELVASQQNARKMENHHELLGLIHLLQLKYAKAVEHYRQADVANNVYVRHHLALALEGAGKRDEARRLFREVGEWNFNAVGFALVRKEALARAG